MFISQGCFLYGWWGGGLGGFEEAGYVEGMSFPLIAVFNPPDSIKQKRNLGCPATVPRGRQPGSEHVGEEGTAQAPMNHW